jgi:Delta7-sterol 5-desaturase
MAPVVRWLSLFLISTSSTTHAEALVGEWATPGYAARVRITPCGNSAESLCGTITWLWEPFDAAGLPLRDVHNPTFDRRSQPLIGLSLLSGFRTQGDRTSARGQIYNPENGRTYKAVMTLTHPDVLQIEGCVLFVCSKQIWRRASLFCEGAPNGQD